MGMTTSSPSRDDARLLHWLTFPDTYGGKLAAQYQYQLPDRGKLNIQQTELRVRTNSQKSYRISHLSDVLNKILSIVVRSDRT